MCGVLAESAVASSCWQAWPLNRNILMAAWRVCEQGSHLQAGIPVSRRARRDRQWQPEGGVIWRLASGRKQKSSVSPGGWATPPDPSPNSGASSKGSGMSVVWRRRDNQAVAAKWLKYISSPM